MNLGDFKSQISGNIRRGAALDDRIPTFIRQAARWIERNHTLQYMKSRATITVDPAVSDTPRYVELSGTLIKSVIWFRWVDDGAYTWLKWKPETEFLELETATPRYYDLDGVSHIVLSSTPSETLTGELYLARYTSWPTADNAEPWLLENAEDVLEARAMINFGKYVRDPQVVAHWREILDDSLPSLYAADQEFIYTNSDLQMQGR